MDEAAATLAEQAVLRQAEHERAPTPVVLSASKGDRWGLQTRIGLLLARASRRMRSYTTSSEVE
jgi:hypothetical protein